MTRSLGWIGAIRFWIAGQIENSGLLVGFGMVAVVAAVIALVTMPTGPAVATRGRIVDGGVLNGHYSLSQGVTITVDGRTIRLALDPYYGCRAGDVIQLDRRRTTWGVSYREPVTPRPCSRAGTSTALGTVR